MADRSKIEAVLAELDELIPRATRPLPARTAEAIRDLLADNDYFREMPSLAAYVKGQEDAAKLARIEARLEALREHVAVSETGAVLLEGTGEYFDVLKASEALEDLFAEFAPAAGTDEAPVLSTATYAMPPESDGHAHLPIQHRDGKPPWCKECGLDAYFKTPVSRLGRKS